MTDTTAQLEAALLTALTTIRNHWDDLLEQSGGTSGGGPKTSDEITALDRRISLRHEATLTLNSWARVIIDDRNVKPWNRCTHGATITLKWPKVGPTHTRCARRIDWAQDEQGQHPGLHAIRGDDTLGLVELITRNAEWFSGHAAAEDALEELANVANEVRNCAAPQAREWTYLGDCPFVIEDWFCSGQVRAYADEPTRLPHCSDCGQEAVLEWWEAVLDVAPLTWPELGTFITRTTGRSVSRFTLSRWVKSGRIPTSGTDDTGRQVFDRGAVAKALEAV